MSIKLAKNSGFCFGVKRAIHMAVESAKKHEQIVTLGPIIHNPQAVKKLQDQGINSVESLDEIAGRTTIIRSHGVKKETLHTLDDMGVTVINATCPYVSKTQDYARQLSAEGYQLVIMGDRNHPEVQAMESYADGHVIIIGSPEDIPTRKFAKIGLICQTTRSMEELTKLTPALLPLCNELRVMNTICNATSIRQRSTSLLAQESDLMIVVGGKNSSNTKMLANISRKYIETLHIETAEELDAGMFKEVKRVGITAGASTPDWIIINVYNKISEYMGNVGASVAKVEDIPGFKEEEC